MGVYFGGRGSGGLDFSLATSSLLLKMAADLSLDALNTVTRITLEFIPGGDQETGDMRHETGDSDHIEVRILPSIMNLVIPSTVL